MSLNAGPWFRIMLVAATVGVASLLSNITTDAQMAGRADVVLAVRMTISLLLNTGTLWGGLSVLAGWMVARPRAAALAGPVIGVAALVVHYGAGQLTGLMPQGSFDSNRSWFVVALAMGAPLGLVGATARRSDRWGLLARLVIPVAALVEPWFQGWFRAEDHLTTPVLIARLVTAAVLTLVGGWGVVRVVRRGVSRPGPHPT